jgi:streptomycin 6-kinase
MLQLPEPVRRKALLAGAEGWLEQLPDLVVVLARDWELTIGAAFTDGTEAFVAAAIRADGTPAVLKVLVPGGGGDAAGEITALRLAGGVGCAALLQHDVDRGALLLERLGPSLYRIGLPIGHRHQILTDAAARVWRPARGCGLPTGADKGRWLIDFISRSWPELDQPCSERAVQLALDCAQRRIEAHDDERAVLVHGDVHQWNALAAGPAPTGRFKLIDPDGLLAEPEYDLGVIMREDPAELIAGDPHDRARWLARRTGLDPTAIWEWGVVERVSTGLVCAGIDLQPVGRELLAAADRIAAEYPRLL